jgi:Domain of unknown function (DUF3336)
MSLVRRGLFVLAQGQCGGLETRVLELVRSSFGAGSVLTVIQKLWKWWVRKKPKDQLLEELAAAKTFEEWQTIAIRLDEVLGNDLW